MKKLILIFGIFLSGIVCVNAQDKGAAKLVDRITAVCALTPDQVTKVQPLAEGYIKTRQSNKTQYANDPASLKVANKTNNQNYKTQLKAILTADQWEKLKAYNAQRKANKKAGKQEGEEQQ